MVSFFSEKKVCWWKYGAVWWLQNWLVPVLWPCTACHSPSCLAKGCLQAPAYSVQLPTSSQNNSTPSHCGYQLSRAARVWGPSPTSPANWTIDPAKLSPILWLTLDGAMQDLLAVKPSFLAWQSQGGIGLPTESCVREPGTFHYDEWQWSQFFSTGSLSHYTVTMCMDDLVQFPPIKLNWWRLTYLCSTNIINVVKQQTRNQVK